MSTKTHYIDGDNYQLRQIIFANTPKAIQQCKSIAPKFKGATEMDTCRNIFDFLKNDIKYVAEDEEYGIENKLVVNSVVEAEWYLIHQKTVGITTPPAAVYAIFDGTVMAEWPGPKGRVSVHFPGDKHAEIITHLFGAKPEFERISLTKDIKVIDVEFTK